MVVGNVGDRQVGFISKNDLGAAQVKDEFTPKMHKGEGDKSLLTVTVYKSFTNGKEAIKEGNTSNFRLNNMHEALKKAYIGNSPERKAEWENLEKRFGVEGFKEHINGFTANTAIGKNRAHFNESLEKELVTGMKTQGNGNKYTTKDVRFAKGQFPQLCLPLKNGKIDVDGLPKVEELNKTPDLAKTDGGGGVKPGDPVDLDFVADAVEAFRPDSVIIIGDKQSPEDAIDAFVNNDANWNYSKAVDPSAKHSVVKNKDIAKQVIKGMLTWKLGMNNDNIPKAGVRYIKFNGTVMPTSFNKDGLSSGDKRLDREVRVKISISNTYPDPNRERLLGSAGKSDGNKPISNPSIDYYFKRGREEQGVKSWVATYPGTNGNTRNSENNRARERDDGFQKDMGRIFPATPNIDYTKAEDPNQYQ